jgi:DMSO/TMAO reductase YedYZ molybdopterin-dependent catalytic subunit
MRSRREFLALTAGGVLWAATPASEKTAPDMIVRSARPEDLEMPPSGFADYITPIDRFFVRTHVAVPTVDPAQWKLDVGGHVASPFALSMEELRRMPAVELVAVLECAGNGRAYYNPPAAGVQWETGAAGNARWRGVRLAEVLKRAGVKDGAVEVLFDGADVPIGTMADFQRSITLQKALDPNTLLAYEMNGETLPLKHGFPLRVVAPGWASDSWTKWVTSIRVLPQPFEGFWMKNAYRHPAQPVAGGAALPPEAMIPVTSLRVKSVIGSPVSGTKPQAGKPMVVSGAAWSGDKGPVIGVEVSLDDGRSWHAARLSGPPTQFGWRLWSIPWTPAATERHYTLLSRARDASGDVQPAVQEWNPSGYQWNVIASADVDVVTGTPGPAPAKPAPVSPADAPPNFRGTCEVCHEEDIIRQQHLSRAQWDREITKMTGWGARLTPDERESFLSYLARTWGR